MSKEELLIALLKSEQSRADPYKSKSNNAEIEEARTFFNEIRNKLSKLHLKKIRKNLYENKKGLESENENEKKKHAEELKKLKKLLQTNKH